MKSILVCCILIVFLRIPLLSQTLNYDPDLWMPDTIPLAFGNTIELYSNNIAFVKLNDGFINFKWRCPVGTSNSSEWTWTANQIGNFKLSLNCFYNGSPVDSVHTIIKVVDKVNVGKKNILAIGNSLTNSGYVYQFPQISKDVNFELNPIGTRGSTIKHEGHPGWLFDSFLKSGSPFYIDNRINFKKYIENNNLPNPDIIRISLGINDCFLSSSHPLDLIMKNATHLVDTINNDYPNSAIIIALPSTCESTGIGWQVAYGNLDNYERYQLHMRELRKRMDAKFGCGRYKPNIRVSYDGFCIDRIYGYPNNGSHPNSSGYAQLAKGFSNTLNNMLWESLSTLSIERNTSNQISLFPNPGNDKITITGFNTDSKLRVMNVLGKEVYRVENISYSTEIDISNFIKGIYLIIINDRGNCQITKFIKN